ncbi:MAG: Murein DD-endopeptidase MepM [candidate division BRC1 bacterium ADurb.BinA364]|nr:MAG: Murein DD-endopeptidase MepM [candidate division BRC1 bacterium ADurb.BinA364]
MTRTRIALLNIVACLALAARAWGGSSLDDLNLRLVGSLFFQGEASALIEDGKTGKQTFYEINQRIGDFTITDIQTGKVLFENGGKSYALAMASMPELEPPPPPDPVHYSARSLKSIAPPSINKPVARPPVLIAKPVEPPKPFFALPMGGDVRSGFGYRKHPMGGGTKFHSGVDIAAPHGTSIRAAAEGVVAEATYDRWFGYYILIRHKNGYSTKYAHLSRIKVRKGQYVSQGETIGYEGATGQSTGPHLHFEIHKDGVSKDPGIYISALDR